LRKGANGMKDFPALIPKSVSARGILVFLSLAFMVFSSAVLDHGSILTQESFLLQGKNLISVSIESYKRADGWVPVGLSLGEIELMLWMDEGGQVKERKRRDFRSLFSLDPAAQEMSIGGTVIPLELRGKSAVRMRLRPLEDTIPVTMSIKNSDNRLSFIIGDSELELDLVRVEYVNTSQKIREIRFAGSVARMEDCLLLLDESGKVYAADRLSEPADFSEARIWAERKE